MSSAKLEKQRPVLALIPARGGSKGLVGKNMLNIKGIPLVGYSLRAALNSEVINEVYLSSDDEATLEYGEKLGAKVLFRPSELSSDNASANLVVEHFISNLPKSLLAKL